MSYEAWRATFQSSEQAARTAYQELQAARAQSGQVVEPVAWSWEYRGLHVSTDKAFVEKIAADGFAIRPLVFADTQTSQQGGVPDEWLELLARRAEDSDITYEATYDPGYDKPIHHDCDIEERVADWIRDQKGKTSQPAQQGSVPDYVNEALQRLIENGGNLGPASREDALVVARYRRELLATPQPEGDGNKRHWYALSYRGKDRESGCAADAVTYTGYPENALTIARIQAAKADAGVDDKAVLVCATYLGHMTKEEFTAQSPQEAPDDE